MNNNFIKVLKGEDVDRPPVWMMRQAGRYLPDYMKLKAKYSFFERIETPELATEITIMPVHQVGVDAAILFSDILVIPKVLGINVELVPGKGPLLESTVTSEAEYQKLNGEDIISRMPTVEACIKMIKHELPADIPLIGFVGSPWTVFCYMVQGKGSKDFSEAKSFAFNHPELALKILDKITEATITYLGHQIESGIDVFQVFDSWGGLLDRQNYLAYSLPFIHKICNAFPGIPSIVFAKGGWHLLEDLNKIDCQGLGLDWTISADYAKSKISSDKAMQGNLDPSMLLSSDETLVKRTNEMIESFEGHRYIANLGHGILPNIPVEKAKLFVDTVKAYRY
ncbi:uroporphyrinogen decarboxylase [Portibacter lacus]|uniref:Uroporphyrinogen decarboxylase n=1 Tax=Portibacter lacus TaxID=1099794 RepID=A0AA37SW96_9BACT|nr:uroporphyrinogen decarboxylase [Portibacter lacus]GLR19113.1 uroporphyrinogen decarboxylase [Portibacter lacus]